MFELIQLRDSHEKEIGIGLTNSFRDRNFNMRGDYSDEFIEEMKNFVEVDSCFYPFLNSYYKDRVEEWAKRQYERRKEMDYYDVGLV